MRWYVFAGIVVLITILISVIYQDGSEDSENLEFEKEMANTEIVEKIAQDYHATHTYTASDFFVCSDMALDMWNLIKTKGINAKLQVGNVDENISEYEGFEIFSRMNHAWVIAEVAPFTWLAVEPTGGYTVYADDNRLYYWGISFDSPREFKRFSELRKDLLVACPLAVALEEECRWKLIAAQALVEVWRSLSANQRAEAKVL